METLLLVLLIATATLACPAMMWWQRWQGRAPACRAGGGKRPGDRREEPSAELDELRFGHDRLAARIAEQPSVDDLRAEQRRIAAEIDRLEHRRHEHAANGQLASR
jgi:hypothetical protein